MQVLPIKLPDELYQDLKTVSRETNTPMAKIIKDEIGPKIAKITKKIKQQQAKNSIEYMLNNPITGKNYLPNLTDDEILYGYSYNKQGKKTWQKPFQP